MNKILGIIVCSLLMLSCNNTQEKVSNVEVTTIKDTSHQQALPEIIEMDNGQKWKMNAEMRPFIAAGEGILKTYTESNSKDYTTLAAQLKEKDDALIKSCTMKGKSHDELHKWLHPHLGLVAALAKAENEQQAKDLIMQLNKSFEAFHQYFE